MKRSWTVWVLLGVLCAGSVLPPLRASAADARLKQFEITSNPDKKEVRVTLFTTDRASYTTEKLGSKFSIHLDHTRLDETLAEAGMPVVIDNQNQFIGRAVPDTEGNTQIIIPNLPPEEYAITIVQKLPGQPAIVEGTTVVNKKARPVVVQAPKTPRIAPRLPVSEPAAAPVNIQAADSAAPQVPPSMNPRSPVAGVQSQFETLAASLGESLSQSFSQAVDQWTTPKTSTRPRIVSKRTTSPAGNTVNNPYYQPSAGDRGKPAVNAANTAAIPAPPMVPRTMSEASAPGVNQPLSDPLAALHALPAVGSVGAWPGPGWNPLTAQNDLPPMVLQPETAVQETKSAGAAASAQSGQNAPKTWVGELKQLFRDSIAAVPAWVYWLSGLFILGLGVMVLAIGGVLLRMLWLQTRKMAEPVTTQSTLLPAQPALPDATPVRVSPVPLADDTTTLDPTRYWKSAAQSVEEAVRTPMVLHLATPVRRAHGLPPRTQVRRPAPQKPAPAMRRRSRSATAASLL
ncbi:MAG: hypothetical protein AB7P76_01830 [Candidatus Melainabacteria bacterium]